MPTGRPLLQQAASAFDLVGLGRAGTSIDADFARDVLLVTDPPLPGLHPAQPAGPSVMASTWAGK